MLEKVVNEFMQKEYGLSVIDSRTLEILRICDFTVDSREEEQFNICKKTERKIFSGSDELIAKVFVLAYPYDFILHTQDDGTIKNWAAWLAGSEYRAGNAQPQPIKRRFLEKNVEHLVESYKRGNNTKEISIHIGGAYYKLGEYKEALPFLLEARSLGDDTTENDVKIGTCCFRLKLYDDALEYFLKVYKTGNNAKEAAGYIGNCYYSLGNHMKALDYLLIARKNGYDTKETSVNIADCYSKLSMFKEAADEFERALGQTPQSCTNKGFLNLFENSLKKARQYARKTLPENEETNKLLQEFMVVRDKLRHYRSAF